MTDIKRSLGFTLMELIITVIIVGILSFGICLLGKKASPPPRSSPRGNFRQTIKVFFQMVDLVCGWTPFPENLHAISHC